VSVKVSRITWSGTNKPKQTQVGTDGRNVIVCAVSLSSCATCYNNALGGGRCRTFCLRDVDCFRAVCVRGQCGCDSDDDCTKAQRGDRCVAGRCSCTRPQECGVEFDGAEKQCGIDPYR
jgi:hypothetical protein